MADTKKETKTTEKINENKFAVIKIAGTQLKVVEGKEYDIRKIDGEKGDKLEIAEVLLVSDGEKTTLGTPYIEGTKVIAEIASQKKGEKISGFKYSAKSRTRRHFGSRPLVTRILVKKI